MSELMVVCLGGAIGSGARYLVSLSVDRWAGRNFPFGTFTVNVLGSLLLGVLMELFLAHKAHHPALRLALTTGVMGGFTTYSTFNQETLRMVQSGAFGIAAVYVIATVISCLAAGALGGILGRIA